VKKIFSPAATVFALILSCLNFGHYFIVEAYGSVEEDIFTDISLTPESRRSVEEILPLTHEQLKTIETGDILLMTGTNSFSFLLRSPYTHVGMMVRDCSDRLFVFESSWGFSGIPSSYETCDFEMKGQEPLGATTADGLRIIPLRDIKRYYDERKQEVKYHVFKQKKGIDKK